MDINQLVDRLHNEKSISTEEAKTISGALWFVVGTRTTEKVVYAKLRRVYGGELLDKLC